MRAVAIFSIAGALVACPGPRRPTPVAVVEAVTLEIGRTGGSLRGVAGDAAMTFAAITAGEGAAQRTTIEARRGATVVWSTALAGAGGPIARTSSQLVATLTGVHAAADVPLRGSPGVVAVGLDAATGAVRWKVAIDSSEWSVIGAVAAAGDDVLVGGAFSGSLRARRDREPLAKNARPTVVSSGGKADGFLARIGPTGEVGFLVRVGGPGADAIQGVAAAGDRIAIAGTFAAGADLLGTPLKAFDERSPYGDGFVAELDGKGAPRWSSTWGGKLDDSVAGVAIDARGRVVVAANARDVMHINHVDLIAKGKADALIAWWARDGTPGTAVLVGGAEFDGATGIAAVGDRVVVGCFFAGAIRIGERALTATGDDALLVAFEDGGFVDAWPVSGEGREEIAALAAVPGGFIAGVTHTAAATVAGASLRSPADPLSGAAIIVRPVR